MKKTNILLLCAMVFSLFACNDEYPDLEDGLYVAFETTNGPIVAELFYDQTPITVASFVSLAEGKSTMVDSTYKGKKFYDGLTFHRVIDGFVIQGGDPSGTGSGGPGYRFPDETLDSLSHDSKGILSMANAGPGTNGSQFFITLAPTPNLDGRHTVFGQVVKGLDVVDSIGKVQTGPMDKPLEPVVMKTVTIVRKGKDAKNFDAPKVFDAELKKIEAKDAELAKELEAAKAKNAAEFEALKEKAETLDSGLEVYFETKGEGPKPNNGDKITVHYEGYFTDGTLFDTSREDLAQENGIFSAARKSQNGYGPMATQYGPDAPMIPGFKEGMMQMQVGDEVVLFIPSHLAYGERGAGGVIPPNTDLIFKIEMVSIKE